MCLDFIHPLYRHIKNVRLANEYSGGCTCLLTLFFHKWRGPKSASPLLPYVFQFPWIRTAIWSLRLKTGRRLYVPSCAAWR